MDEIDAFFDACFDQPISKPECSGNPIASNSVCDVDTFFDLSMGTKSNNSIPVAGKSCDKSGTSETKNRNKSSSNSRLFSWRKKKAIQNYQVDTWMKAMLQSLSHASSCQNTTMAASPFATKHAPTTANSTFAIKLMFFGRR